MLILCLYNEEQLKLFSQFVTNKQTYTGSLVLPVFCKTVKLFVLVHILLGVAAEKYDKDDGVAEYYSH